MIFTGPFMLWHAIVHNRWTNPDFWRPWCTMMWMSVLLVTHPSNFICPFCLWIIIRNCILTLTVVCTTGVYNVLFGDLKLRPMNCGLVSVQGQMRFGLCSLTARSIGDLQQFVCKEKGPSFFFWAEHPHAQLNFPLCAFVCTYVC